MSHTPPTPRYTDADVDLAARALWEECTSEPGSKPTPTCYEDARAVLAVLSTAGWRRVPAHLLPLLDLTADVRSDLDKLTTTEEPS